MRTIVAITAGITLALAILTLIGYELWEREQAKIAKQNEEYWRDMCRQIEHIM